MAGMFICQKCEAQHDTWNGSCPACGGTELVRLSPQVDRMVGRIITGRYKILRRLGQGGMGSVYLAEQVGIGQQVALKFLNSALSMDADVVRRFLNEAKSYARVSHPNAVTLHEFGQDEEGGLFISMEYVEGDDLKRLLATVGRLPVHEAVDVILQVADVLAYAHARQVIHRDLKPENIVARQGMRGWHIKVLDFGIARIADGATRLTAQGAVAGTPRYMSPEQAMAKEVDARADIYSVGVVLFELLTGRQPFDGTSVGEIMHKQVHQPMPHLTDVAPDLDYAAIDAVIQKATSKNRVERHPSMEAFARDLSNAMPTLTGRSPISGVVPTVKAGEEPRSSPGTLLFGDGSEATLVRSPTPAVAAGSSTGVRTQVPNDTGRMTPIPLTQPAPGVTQLPPFNPPVPLSDGFDKTSHAVSPYTQAQRSRSGLVMGLTVAVALVAAGVAIVTARGGGNEMGTRDAAPTQAATPAVAPLEPPQAIVSEKIRAKEPTNPSAPVVEPSAPPPRAQDPGTSPVSAPDNEQKRRMAEENLARIQVDFDHGELETVEKLMKLSQDLHPLAPGFATLQARIDDANTRLERISQLVSADKCEKATEEHRAFRKKFAKISTADTGIKKCEKKKEDENILPDQMDLQ